MTVPPSIEKPRTVIGISYRDSIIAIVGIGLAIACFIIPGPFFIRVALAVFLFGICFGIAFGREPKSGKTIEQFVLDFIRFAYRPRHHRRGSAGSGFNPYPQDGMSKSHGSENDQEARNENGKTGIVFTNINYQPISLGVTFFLSLFSCSFLLGFSLWLWFGGAVEIGKLFSTIMPF